MISLKTPIISNLISRYGNSLVTVNVSHSRRRLLICHPSELIGDSLRVQAAWTPHMRTEKCGEIDHKTTNTTSIDKENLTFIFFNFSCIKTRHEHLAAYNMQITNIPVRENVVVCNVNIKTHEKFTFRLKQTAELTFDMMCTWQKWNAFKWFSIFNLYKCIIVRLFYQDVYLYLVKLPTDEISRIGVNSLQVSIGITLVFKKLLNCLWPETIELDRQLTVKLSMSELSVTWKDFQTFRTLM